MTQPRPADSLLAERLRNDPRVQQARQLLLQTLAQYQTELTQPRPAMPGKEASYQQLLRSLEHLRGGSLFYPYLGSGFGSGPLVELADGSVKYDMISGIGVHQWGHGHPALTAAGIDAALTDTVMQGNLQQHVDTVSLSQQFTELACRGGAGLQHCFLTSSGAMANENALKLAFQRKQPADRVLAFDRNFAGRTLAMSQISDKPANRDGLPLTVTVDYVPFYDASRPAQSTEQAMGVLTGHLQRYPRRHAAMVLELIQGEAGYHPGDTRFFKAIIDLLHQHEIAVIVDEIQSFGRTSEPFAFQHFQLDADVDIVTVGKMTQVCCTLFSDAFVPKAGLISQTFTASTSAMMAAGFILEQLASGDLFGPEGRNMRMHQQFVTHLERIGRQYPDTIQGPYGTGAMIAMTPFDGSAKMAQRFARALFANGVIGFVAGANPSRVRFLPPAAVVSDHHVDAVCGIIEQTVAQLAGGEKQP